ncbi:carbonic anhydrase 2-like [Clytia hemisphaerica]|uniref:Carbonic anhydrase n=1 Tax=Clytia hemisphaerica TaxID=252671 RepID=A0A7M5UX18_9CNID|eukprot:TCONS_00072987-protein
MKLLLLIGSCLLATSQASEWDYNAEGDNGPADWGKRFPKCNDTASSSRQSPINIVVDNTKYNASLPTPEFINYDVAHATSNLIISNNGHTVVVTPKYASSDSKAQIKYKGKTYELVQFHFHWGSDSKRGSEHTIDGKHFQVEVHFVHYNTDDFNNFNEAKTEEGGLLVYAQFLKSFASSANAGYQEIVPQFEKVKYKGNTTTIPHFKFDTLLSKVPDRIYSYPGSLTTPTCDESVSWIVNSQTVEISQDQMSKFLELKSNKGETNEDLVNNYRPVQKLQQRTVETNVPGSGVTITSSFSMMLMTVLPIAYAFF